MTSTDGPITRAARWTEENKELIASNIGPILLTGLSVWVGLWAPTVWDTYNALEERNIIFWLKQKTPWLVLIGVLIALFGSIGSTVRVKKKEASIRDLEETIASQTNLSNRLEEAQQAVSELKIQHTTTLYHVSSDYLGHIATDHMGFNDTERLSLYMHTGEYFELIGRFSKNLEYRKVARTRFPDNQGCIGRAWAKGGRYFEELPDEEKEYYKKLKEDLNIDKGVAKALRMPSKAYCSSALVDGYARIGVVVFESTRKGVLNEAKIYEVIDRHKAYLVEMLKRCKADLDQAQTQANLEDASSVQAA